MAGDAEEVLAVAQVVEMVVAQAEGSGEASEVGLAGEQAEGSAAAMAAVMVADLATD